MPVIPGAEFLVNSSSAHKGGGSSIAVQEDGSFLIAWTVKTSDSSQPYSEIYGRAFSATGAVLTNDFVVNAERTDPQYGSDVVALPGGGYLVAYTSGDADLWLEWKFAATRFVTSAGVPTGIEQFGVGRVQNDNPDLAVLNDGSYMVLTSADQDDPDKYYYSSVRSQFHSADGTLTATFLDGNLYRGHATTGLLGGQYLIAWNGWAVGEPDEGDPFGIYGQIRGSDGAAVGDPFLIAEITAEWADMTLRLLDDGRVAVLWDPLYPPPEPTSPPLPSDVFPGEIRLSILDPVTKVATAPQPVVPDGTDWPDFAVLGNGDIVVVYVAPDASGSGIWGRILHEDGTLDPAFAVNSITNGQQSLPAVAARGDDGFVVTWDSPGGTKARIFDQGDLGGPTSALYLRPGTIDLSPSEDQTVSGGFPANSFYVDLAATSGQDRILDFGDNDLFLTRGKLVDSDSDGVIPVGPAGLEVDGAGSEDLIRFDALDGGLRYLGESEGLSVYATGGVRPAGAIEGKLGKDVLSGDVGDAASSIFFVDSALGIALGEDSITRFGARDILVTTTLLPDGNHDGIIGFGRDNRLDVGKDSIAITNVAGGRVFALEYDGKVVDGGTSYYVYSLEGSAAGVGDLIL